MNYLNEINNVFVQRDLIERIKNIEVSNENFCDIIIMLSMIQKENGEFDLSNKNNMPNDMVVYLCDEVNYICTSLYIKAYVNKKQWFVNNIGLNKLNKALEICSKKRLMGHGYNGISTQINALKTFAENDIKVFLLSDRDLNRNFTHMIESILADYKEKIYYKKIHYFFGTSEQKVKEIIELYKL